MDRQPSSIADPFWPPIHGEARVALPALPEFLGLLRARGRQPEVKLFSRPARGFESLEELHGFIRRQLWLAEGRTQDRLLRRSSKEPLSEVDGRWSLPSASLAMGLVQWTPAGDGPMTNGSSATRPA